MFLPRLVVLILSVGALLACLPESVAAGARGGVGHRFDVGGTSSVVGVPFLHPRPFSSFEFPRGTTTVGPHIIVTPKAFGTINRQLLTPTTGMPITTEITTILPSPKFLFPSTPLAIGSPGQTVVLQRGSSIVVEGVVPRSVRGVQSESVTVIVQRGSSVVVESLTARSVGSSSLP